MKNERNNEDSTDPDSSNETQSPDLYKVVIVSDSFTPMEFVMSVLERFFYMEPRAAAVKMLEAHNKGKAVCGVFSKDVAVTKISQVMEYVTLHKHPFNCSMEAI